jgi:hypothetical protein
MKQYFRDKLTASRTHLLTFALLTACLSSGCRTSIGSRDGKVIDFVSKEGIPQAAVTLTCTVPKIAHGSDKKIRETISAADGSYHFDPTGLNDCDFFFARANKAGYGLDHMTDALTNPGPDSSRQIPKIVYLIKESDQPMVLLQRLTDFLSLDPPAAGPYAPNHFFEIYKRFISSRKIARTSKTDMWLREFYCARLNASWQVLTDEQRAALKVNDNSEIDGSPISLRPDSYEKEVRPYCGGRGTMSGTNGAE